MSHYRTLMLLCILISVRSFAQIDSNPEIGDTTLRIFEKVDIEASFPGGEQAWRKFLEKNLNPNVPVDNDAPLGMYTVYIQFVVDKEGNVTDIKALTKHGYGMEQEVIRLMHRATKWSPAQQNDRAVKAYRKQPVTFMLTEEGFDVITKVPYVLFTGENELTVKISGTKDKDLEATITQGTIVKSEDGKFTANIPKPGRVVINFRNTKKNKDLGSMSFEVKAASAGKTR